MVMSNYKNLCVFKFAVPLKSRKFDAHEMCVFYSSSCNVLSQLLFHMASRNLREFFPRCTVYKFLVQKVPRMHEEMPSSALKI